MIKYVWYKIFVPFYICVVSNIISAYRKEVMLKGSYENNKSPPKTLSLREEIYCVEKGQKAIQNAELWKKNTRNDNTDRKNCCRIDLSSMKEGKK